MNGRVTDHDLIKSLSPIYSAQQGDTINLEVNLGSFIQPHQMLYVVSSLRSLDQRGVIKNGSFFYDEDSINYVSRMNFFDSLDVNYKENFVRRDPSDNFIEITNFNGDDAHLVAHKIIRVLRKNSLINKSVLYCLDYCIGEVLDNVDLHSESVNGGWVVAQYYPKLSRIKLMVCDTGIGILKSLSKVDKYSTLKESEALIKCIEPKVTDGRGMGMGLYYTHKFVNENKGVMHIHSGGNKLILTDRRLFISQCASWSGTAVYLEIRTDVEVQPELIADGYVDFVDAYHDRYGDDDAFDLW